MSVERDIANAELRIKYLEEDRTRLAAAVTTLVQLLRASGVVDTILNRGRLDHVEQLAKDTQEQRYDAECYPL